MSKIFRTQRLHESVLLGPIIFAILLLGSACPDKETEEQDTRPPALCMMPPDSADGPLFTDVSTELGLDVQAMDLQGNLVATADIDGDRWPDLFVSKAVQGARDDPADPAHHVRLLRNLQGQGFSDITFASGFTDTRDAAQGRAMQFAIFADFDNDGSTDFLSANFLGNDTTDVGDRSEILLNDGTGHFHLGPANYYSDSYDLNPVVSATTLDFDHDGNIDLFIGQHYASYGSLASCGEDKLLQNNGFAALTDVTDAMGLGTVAGSLSGLLAAGHNNRPTWGVSSCDLNGDGWSDLLVSAYGRQFNPLWMAQGGQSYVDKGRELGFWSDANLDYSDNAFYRCHCHAFAGACDPMPPAPSIQCAASDYWNAGFDDQPFRLGGNSSNSICGDVDNDGDLDVLQVELAHWHIGQSSDKTELLYNDGLDAGQALRRPGNSETGLTREHANGWNEGDLGGALVDFDNDGRLDVLVSSSDYPDTGSMLWKQGDDGKFVNITQQSGLFQDRAHGLSLIDYDRDGDYDVVLGTSLMRWTSSDQPPRPAGAYVHVYRNNVGQLSNRVILDVQGAGVGAANTMAIGARIVVKAGEDSYTREIQGGHGLDGQQHDMLQIIGVGAHCEVDSVEIHWPDAAQTVSHFEHVRANYVLLIRQNQDLQYQTIEKYRGEIVDY